MNNEMESVILEQKENLAMLYDQNPDHGPLAAFLNALSNFGIEASVMDYVEDRKSNV